jgi:hypothetical protein
LGEELYPIKALFFYSVHLYVNGKMKPVETIPGIKENVETFSFIPG